MITLCILNRRSNCPCNTHDSHTPSSHRHNHCMYPAVPPHPPLIYQYAHTTSVAVPSPVVTIVSLARKNPHGASAKAEPMIAAVMCTLGVCFAAADSTPWVDLPPFHPQATQPAGWIPALRHSHDCCAREGFPLLWAAAFHCCGAIGHVCGDDPGLHAAVSSCRSSTLTRVVAWPS